MSFPRFSLIGVAIAGCLAVTVSGAAAAKPSSDPSASHGPKIKIKDQQCQAAYRTAGSPTLVPNGDGTYSADLGNGGGRFILGGNRSDTIIGTDFNDIICGGNGGDSIDGGAGDDFIYGGNGKDTIDGGAGADYIEGNNGGDTLDGGADDPACDSRNWFNNLPVSNTCADPTILNGPDPYDDDIVYGNNGSDDLAGDLGDDQLYGGNGSDNFTDDPGCDRFDGGKGNDNISVKGNNCPADDVLIGPDDKNGE